MVLTIITTGCTDRVTTSPERVAPAERPSSSFTGPAAIVPTDWRGYWNNDTTLWIYDQSAEIGINSNLAAWVDVDYARELGIRIIRFPIHWEALKAGLDRGCPVSGLAADGTPRTDCPTHTIREIAERAMANDVELLAVVSPHAQAEGTIPSGEAAFDEFARVLGRLAYEFDGREPRVGRIRFWQVLNEPDVCPYAWFLGPEPKNGNRAVHGRVYARLLRKAWSQVKTRDDAGRTGNPDAWIVSAALTGMGRSYTCDEAAATTGTFEWDFFDGMYQEMRQNPGSGFYDILAVNVYGRTPWDRDGAPASFQQAVHRLNEKLGQVQDANRPVWATEFGASAARLSCWGQCWPVHTIAERQAWVDQAQRDWYQQAVALHTGERAYNKAFAFSLYSDEHGTTAGFTGTELPPFSTTLSGCHEGTQTRYTNHYGYGLIRNHSYECFKWYFRPDQAPSFRDHPEFRRPDTLNWRPAFKYLRSRGGANASRRLRTGDFGVGHNGQVPKTQAFHYGPNGEFVLENVQVSSLHPTRIGFFFPYLYKGAVAGQWGWWVANGHAAGSGYAGVPAGKLEALKLSWPRLDLPPAVTFEYRAFVEWDAAWQRWVSSTEAAGAGTIGEGRGIQAIEIRTTASSPWGVCYQVQRKATATAALTWEPFVCDGQTAGVAQQGWIHAIRLRLYRK